MSEENQKLLDQFAMSALSAIIAKMPFYDTTGEHGKVIEVEQIRTIMKAASASAYEYATYMMIEREISKKWLKSNIDANPDFGTP